MSSQFLFAYGTLRSDQPEHALHCPTPRSIAKASAPGALYRLREGYPILQIEPRYCALDATRDPVADWASAETNAGGPPDLSIAAIQGELHEYSLESGALERMDAWENFRPGVESVYQRRIIWVRDADGSPRLAWAYVCAEPPKGSVALNTNIWQPR